MGSLDPLVLLRDVVCNRNAQPVLLDESGEVKPGDPIEIGQAKYIFFPGAQAKYSLDEPTRFIKNPGSNSAIPVSIGSIYYAFLLRQESTKSYITQCQENGITTLSFYEKTDLIAWLEGASESDHIKKSTADNVLTAESNGAATVGSTGSQTAPMASAVDSSQPKRPTELRAERDSLLETIYGQEYSLSDRMTILRGSKEIDFSSVNKLAHELIISKQLAGERELALQREKDRNKLSGVGSNANSKRRIKDPIILIPSSPSSLLSMFNVKKFLEEGIFIPPAQAAKEAGGGRPPDLQTFTRKSERLGGGARGVRFVVVDNVEKFKLDYWDRVVCVFTTGQKWQFNQYKWQNPQELFHHVKGFYVQYANEPNNPVIGQWNVDVVKVEGNPQRRHVDREHITQLWDKIEQFMVQHWKSNT